MHRDHQPRGLTRAITALLAAASLAACADEAPTAATAKLPEGGVQSLAPSFDLLPSGQTFKAKPAFVTGSPNGKSAYVQVYDKDGAQLIRFKAFTDPWDIGGVEVALGDVNGDGWPDIIAGEGPAHFAPISTRISAWDGHDGRLLGTTLAEGTYHDGARVGTGDYDGDGRDEIFMCTGPSTVWTHYEIIGYTPTAPTLRSRIQIEGIGRVTGKATYNGCRATGGDLDGDGKDELIAVFEGPANALMVRLPSSGAFVRWNALGAGYTGSTSIAAADVNGDKKAEVFLGRLTGTDKLPPVFMYDGAKVWANGTLPTPAITYPITNSIYNTGIYVAAHDLSLDGIPELMAKLSTTGGNSMYVARQGPTFTSLWMNTFEPPGNLPAGGPIN
jgi:FG-GAP-like repeat